MVKNSNIEWTDHTFNPWIGCQKVSPACKHCYAETLVNRFGGDFAGTRRLTTDAYWRQPLKWNSEAEKSGTRPRVFCASLADVFENWDGHIHDSKGEVVWHEAAGETLDMNAIRDRLFDLINETPHLDWLLLTKRPENIWDMWPKFFDAHGDVIRPNIKNVWLGTTVENQEQADKRVPALMDCRELAPVLFLSCEPMLGPVNLTDVAGKIGIGLHTYDVLNGKKFHWDDGGCWTPCDTIDWVIAGGESGHEARPMHPDWVRSLRDQCNAAQVPFHFKQWGEFAPESAIANDKSPFASTFLNNAVSHSWGKDRVYRVGKSRAGRLLDGREWNELPTKDRVPG